MPAGQPGAYKHPDPNPAWLARRVEDILDPELPIIDPHHHLWNHAGNPYLLDELLADTGTGHNIVGTVFVQCGWAYREGAAEMRPVGETEAVAAAAEEAQRRRTRIAACAAIVGHADLRLGARIDPVLEAHMAAAGGRFRGIRYVTARHEQFVASVAPPAPARIMADPVFREGLARLQKFGLSFDAWLYHTQIAELTDLARAFPGLPIVLDHLGGPVGIGPYRDRRDEVYAAWRSDMKRLADCANVFVKLGGLAMPLTGFDFHEQPLPPSSEELASAWRPYVETCIELYGARRCMFESNFPVDKAACSYPVLWNAFKRIVKDASTAEKRALFHDTAAGFYRVAS